MPYKKEVTENDFRKPEFRGAKPEDYEFRADGEVVRKDRWESGIRKIASSITDNAREFEIGNLQYIVDWMLEQIPDMEEKKVDMANKNDPPPMRTLMVNSTLYNLLLSFAETNFRAFLESAEESGAIANGVTRKNFIEWFEKNK